VVVPTPRVEDVIIVGFKQRAVTVALVLWALGCGGSPVAPGDVPYGQPFDLKVGESLRVGDDGLGVTFQSVKSDSRCPMDAMCIQMGDAVAALQFEVDGKTLTRDLHTDPAKTEARLDRYVVRLVTLLPYPSAARPTAPDDYVAQLRVDKD